MKAQRITIRFEGRVQGVGFRFTAIRLAEDFKVTGYVRNEFDGSVTLVAEGQESQIYGLLSAIRSSHLGRHITAERIQRSASSGEFTGFTLAY